MSHRPTHAGALNTVSLEVLGLTSPGERSWAEIDSPSSAGDIVYMRVFGREVVHLNSGEAALELLGNRSFIYSDRPKQVMGGELVGRSRSVVFQPYGPRLRTSRRLLIDFVGARSSRGYWPAQEHAAAKLMCALAESPEKFVAHINRSVCSCALASVVAFEHKMSTNP